MRSISILLALLLCISISYANTYILDPAYSVRCLDLATGETLWETRPDKLKPREAFVAKGFLKIISKTRDLEPETIWIDTTSGKTIEAPAEEPEGLKKFIEPIEGKLTDSQGRNFSLSPGSTKALEYKVGYKRIPIKQLDYYLEDLNISNDIAIYTYSANSNKSVWGGKVYAWDINKGERAWIYDAINEIPNAKASSFTSVDVDDDRAYVAIEQNIIALNAANGEVIWKTRLPHQNLRPWDNAWTGFYIYRDHLFVKCYEDLFLVSPDDGKIIWRHDPGPFARAYPLVHDNKVFVFPYNK